MEKGPQMGIPQQEKEPQKELGKLSDEVVALRPFELKDAEAHFAGEDEEQVKWLNEGAQSTLEGVQKWIHETREEWERGGPVFTFAIHEQQGDAVMGMIEAQTDYEKFHNFKTGDVNISYALYPSGRGKGYVGRALKLVESFLEEKGLKRTVIRVEPENIASKNIPIKGGYQKIGEIKEGDGKVMEIFAKELKKDE